MADGDGEVRQFDKAVGAVADRDGDLGDSGDDNLDFLCGSSSS